MTREQEPSRTVLLEIDGDDLLVAGPDLSLDRGARLFFRSVLGASQSDGGAWRCPRRRLSMSALVLRVHDWLEARGYEIERRGAVDSLVARELERRRSFRRTKEAAARLKSGLDPASLPPIDRSLEEFGWLRPLRPHQRDIVAHGLTAVNAANFSVPGAGKTASTLAIAATHLHARTVELVVVVGPLACFDPWERETHATVRERIRTRRLRGTAAQRQRIYDSIRTGELLLMSYATAAADQAVLLETFDHYRVMLVVDESHRIKRFRGGVWAPALVELARRARVRIVLSGTPMPQSGRDLFTQLSVLWPDGQLTGTRDAFAARVESDFPGIVRDVLPFVSRTPKSALGLPPYTIVDHRVPLSGTQAELYGLIENGFRRRLAEADTWRDKIETLRRARPLRLIQVATNPDVLNIRDNYFRLPKVHDASPTLMDRLVEFGANEVPAKSEAALHLIDEIAVAGGKVVCWSNFIGNLDQFSRLVRERLRLPTFQIDGRVPAGVDALRLEPLSGEERPGDVDTRERVIQRFLGEPGPSVLVTNPASCSESISLHSTCHNAIYLDRTYDCAMFLQSIDRIHRLGLPADAEVSIHLLHATIDGVPTIDGLVDGALKHKAGQMQHLLEGAELLPMNVSEDPADDADGDDNDLAGLLRYLLGEAV